ncbi:hypothetical protein FRB97_007877 [Tulasnella sp. 331]|nr:hypothetical protein FRB97_007877 [Tulasnella sp. 331]
MNQPDVGLPQYNRRSSSSTVTRKPPASIIPSTSRETLPYDVMMPHTKPEPSPLAQGPRPAVLHERLIEPEPQPGGYFRRLPRITWLFSAYILTGAIAATWLVYCCVRYTRATQVYRTDPLRFHYTVAFSALSFVALGVVVANLCVVSVGVKLTASVHVVDQCLLLLASISALVPAAFNVGAIAIHHSQSSTRDPYLSLVGRCSIDSDIVWSGVAFHWLTWIQVVDPDWGTPTRQALSISFSTASLVPFPPQPVNGKLRKKRHSSQAALSPTTDNAQPQWRTFSTASSHSHHQSASNLTYVPSHLLRPVGPRYPFQQPQPLSGQDGSSPRRGGLSPKLSPHDPVLHTGVYQYEAVGMSSPLSSDESGDGAADLNRFAASFRSLVERVSRETESAAVLATSPSPPPVSVGSASPDSHAYTYGYGYSGRRSFSPPSRRRSYSPPPSGTASEEASSSTSSHPLQRSNSIPPSHPPSTLHRFSSEAHSQYNAYHNLADVDTLNMQRRLLNAHQVMLMEQAERSEMYEHVVVLGSAVRRMSTIPSLSETAPRTPTSEKSLALGGHGAMRNSTTSSALSMNGTGLRRFGYGTGATPTPTPPPISAVDATDDDFDHLPPEP